MFKIIKESIAILDASPKMQRGLQKFMLINSKRQPPSLKKLLTHAKFSDKEKGSSTTTVNHCKDKRCKACDVLHTCNELKFNKSSENFKIKANMDCSAKDILYFLKCGGCNKQYIGETGDPRARVRVHKQQIKDPRLRKLYASHHIAHCALTRATPFSIVPFFFINRGDKIYREVIEEHFIQKFRPELNRD